MKRFLLFIIALTALVFLAYFLYTYNEKALFWSVDNNNLNTFSSIIEKDRSLINLKNGSGTPLLIHCLKNGRDTMALHLLERNADANQKDSEGRTALFYPTSKATLKLILSQEVDVNVKDTSGFTPLHAIDDIDILALFISIAGDRLHINAKNVNKITPLMWAIMRDEKVKKVEILLNNGANIYCKDRNGSNCLDHARNSDNLEIRDLIEEENLNNSLRIKKLDEMPVSLNLTGTSFGIRNSMAVNNFTIPDECDELIVVGYGGKRGPDEYLKIFDGLAEISASISGKKAIVIYQAIKELSDVFSTGSVRVDFFITSKSNGTNLRNDPDAIVYETLLEKNNTSGFKHIIALEDGFSPEKEMCAVVKNKHNLQEVDFSFEIYSVVHSKKRPCTEDSVSREVSIEPNRKSSINTGPEVETYATASEEETILTKKKII